MIAGKKAGCAGYLPCLSVNTIPENKPDRSIASTKWKRMLQYNNAATEQAARR
jgi:hypothetical protein